MGTTAAKLTYLGGTKDKLKQVINYTGANITNDTFRSYPDKLFNKLVEATYNPDNLWEGLPHVTGSAESLTLNHTEYSKMKLTLKGNTSQYTTTGKQLFNTKLLTNQTFAGGINIAVDNEGKWTFNGTSTQGGTLSLVMTNQESQRYANKIIYYNTLNAVGNNRTNFFQLVVRNSDNSLKSYKSIGNTSSGSWDLTNESFSNGEYFEFFIYSLGSGISVNKNFEVMISATENVPYEPYTNGASPNPSYPQPIHSVSGDNTIEVCGKNLFDEEYELGTINYETGALETSTTIIRTKNYQTIKPSTQYTLKVPNEVTGIILYYYNNGSYIGGLQPTIGSTTHTITFTTNANANQMKWRFNSNYTTLNNQTMFNEGSTSTTYEPYQSQTLPINLPVENLIAHDLATIKTLNTGGTWSDNVYTQNSLNFTINNDGSVRVNGTASANTYLTYPTFTLKAGTYTLGAGIYINTLTRIQLVEDISGRPIIASTENGASSTFTTSADKSVFLQWRINSGEVIDKVFYPMLEKGSKANSYTPYGTTPIELCKIGTYQDYFYKDSGKWYLHKEIGKVMLNGSETILDSGYNASAHHYTYTGAPKLGGQTNLLSDKFYVSTVGTDVYSCVGNANNTNITMKMPLTITTTTDMQTWLSTHNTIFYYQLATPTNTEITDTTLISQLEAIKSAYSYDTQTNISQVNNDKPFIIDAIAIKDLSGE